jgi:hypothetical protein
MPGKIMWKRMCRDKRHTSEDGVHDIVIGMRTESKDKIQIEWRALPNISAPLDASLTKLLTVEDNGLNLRRG